MIDRTTLTTWLKRLAQAARGTRAAPVERQSARAGRPWLALLLALAPPPLPAQERVEELNEQTVSVSAAGVPMLVTHYKPHGAGPFPLVLINHGRAADPLVRAKLQRHRYLGPARFFVERGFAVAVPTRVGYGGTGGPDLEHHGSWRTPDYPRSLAGALQSILPALEWGRSLPHVDANRLVSVGTSMGGISSLALAACNPPGLVAAINFAGGNGGSPTRSPRAPRAPEVLAASYAALGRAARAPTLWVYAENDLYWGSDLPLQWHEAYVAAGGKADFRMLPAVGRDGHLVFARAPELWAPYVEQFLRERGLLAPAEPRYVSQPSSGLPPPSHRRG